MIVKTEGRWSQFPGDIRQAKSALKKASNDAVHRLAEDARVHLLDNIFLQKLPLAPLVAWYAATKPPGRQILVNTQEYASDISVMKDSGGYRLGLSRGTKRKSSDSSHEFTGRRRRGRLKGVRRKPRNKGATLEQVATYLEFGTSKMPPRPHWRVTEAWVKPQLKDVGLGVLKDVFKF